MSAPVSLSDLQAAINAQLLSLDYFSQTRTAAENSPKVIEIVNEDDKDLETKITKALAELGLMALIGQPDVANQETDRPETKPFNGKFEIEIAVGENPIINRVDGQTFVVCMDAMMAVVQRLHGFKLSGWKPLAVGVANPVRGEKRQVYKLKAVTERVLPPI